MEIKQAKNNFWTSIFLLFFAVMQVGLLVFLLSAEIETTLLSWQVLLLSRLLLAAYCGGSLVLACVWVCRDARSLRQARKEEGQEEQLSQPLIKLFEKG